MSHIDCSADRFHLSVKLLGFLFALGLVFANDDSIAIADDPVFSGPQPGEKLVALNLLGVYDEAAGKEFDPIADSKGSPTLLIFIHKLTRPGLGLARGLTNYAESMDDEKSYAAIAWLDDDKAKAEQYLNRVRKSVSFKVPVGISVDGAEGPGAYGLNRNVELTVLVAKDNQVVANFALIQPSLTDGVKIAGEFAKTLGKTPPTSEELQKIAYPNQRMNQMRRRPAARGERGRPGKSADENASPATKSESNDKSESD